MEMLNEPRAREPMVKAPTMICKAVVDEVFSLLGRDLEAVFLQSLPYPDSRGMMRVGYCFHVVVHNFEQHQKTLDAFSEFSGIYDDPIFVHNIATVRFHDVAAFNDATNERGGLNPQSWHELYLYRPFSGAPALPANAAAVSDDDFPTQSHADAFARIVELAQLHFDGKTCEHIKSQCGGIAPRTYPLITGPSACGKTFIARLLAQTMGAKLNLISAGNWIPRGAEAKPCTMVSILEDVLSNQRVVLCIDEIDKTEENAQKTNWNISNRADIYALLDDNASFDEVMNQLRRYNPALAKRIADEAIDCHELVRERLFIIGAGTWQSEHLAATKGAKVIGFADADDADPSTPLHMRDRLKGNQLIAEELRNRFHSELIELRHPTPQEGRALMDRKGLTAIAQRVGLLHLIESIDWANGGLRNVQSIVAQLAVAHRQQAMQQAT